MTTESNQDEFASIDDLANEAEQGKPDTAQPDPMDNVPEKYRGKTPQELLKIAMDQERFIGRQAEEVGFARKMAEEAVKVRQSAGNTQPTQVEDDLDEVDFFADPRKAVNRAVEQHPEVQRAKQLAQELRKEAMDNKIKAKHNDADSIVTDPEFGEWVQSNKARMKLLQEAHFNFDADAADELLTNFKLQKQVRNAAQQQQVQQLTERQETSLRAAQVDSGTGRTSGKKLLRRADVQELMKDPVKYARYQDLILQAYAEGRVVNDV